MWEECRRSELTSAHSIHLLEDDMLKRVLLLTALLALVAVSGRAQTPKSPNSDGRDKDRAEIRAHIDSIFQAFINKDSAKLRATHHQNWLGYLEGSRTMLRGVDDYMKWSYVDPSSPYGMKSYKMREFDMIFKGDAAFVCFVADVEANTPKGPSSRALRICDFYTKQDGKWIQTGSDTELHPESAEDQASAPRPIGDGMRNRLLDAREQVWRAFFSNDRAALEKLIPEETIAINAVDNNWENRKAIFEGAERFAKSGGKLVKLDFPKTEIQVYGSSAVIYSNYSYEIEQGGQRYQQSGRVTEVFVLRRGQWVNPGWHMDSLK